MINTKNKISATINTVVLPKDSKRRKAVSTQLNFLKNIRGTNKSLSYERIDQLKNAILNSGLFDEKYYLSIYEDIKKSKMDPLNHFISFGIFEGRNPGPDFNYELFIAKNNLKNDPSNPAFLQYLEGLAIGKYSGDDYGKKAFLDYELIITKKLCDDIASSSPLIYMETMSWFDTLRQRPHHLARLLAEQGATLVYLDKSISLPRIVSSKLYLIPKNKNYKNLLAKSDKKNKYFWLFSPTDIKYSQIQAMQKDGYKIIYDYIDEIHESITKNTKTQVENFNNLDKIKPSLLIASAQTLYDELKNKYSNREILMVKNGVDLTHFNPTLNSKHRTAPSDLLPIIKKKKPIIGYYGAIAPWLNYKLMNELSEKRHDLEFVYIGTDYNNSLKRLKLRGNVHFLGPKKYEELAKYSCWFDCAIIPFQEGDIARSTSPVKLFEYMAMGLPTVCTKDLIECEGYQYVYMSKSFNHFEKNIDNAINIRKKRNTKTIITGYAKENTWQARAAIVYSKLMELQ